MPAVLALLLPLIPTLTQSLINVVNAARAAEGTPEEMKAKLDAISLKLNDTMATVAAAQLPSGN